MGSKLTKVWITSFVVMFLIDFLASLAQRSLIQVNQMSGVPWRLQPDATGWAYLVIGVLIGSYAFAYIFLQNYKGNGPVEGFRFGIWVTLLASVPWNLGYAAMLPLGRRLPAAFIVGDFCSLVITGMAAAMVAGKGGTAGATATGAA